MLGVSRKGKPYVSLLCGNGLSFPVNFHAFLWARAHGVMSLPNIFSNISREYHVKEVDKAKGINSNFNSEFYCIHDNYWRQRYRPAVQATVKKNNWRRRVSSASLSLKAPPVYKRRSQTHAFDTDEPPTSWTKKMREDTEPNTQSASTTPLHLISSHLTPIVI